METILCGGCKTIELNGKLRSLVEKIVGKDIKPILFKKEINNSEQNILRIENSPNVNMYVWELKNRKRNIQFTGNYSNRSTYVGSWKNGVPWNGRGFKKTEM